MRRTRTADPRWTDTAPTAVGWHWWHNGDAPVMVLVQDLHGSLVVKTLFSTSPWTVGNLRGVWIGPIEPPTPPDSV